MSEHVLLVGREEGLAARYRRYGSDVAVSVLCRAEHVSRVKSAEDCARAAAVGEALGVATHRRETVAWVQDKHAMRARLRAVGLEDAPAALVTDPAMLRDFAAE